MEQHLTHLAHKHTFGRLHTPLAASGPAQVVVPRHKLPLHLSLSAPYCPSHRTLQKRSGMIRGAPREGERQGAPGLRQAVILLHRLYVPRLQHQKQGGEKNRTPGHEVTPAAPLDDWSWRYIEMEATNHRLCLPRELSTCTTDLGPKHISQILKRCVCVCLRVMHQNT